MVKKKGVIWNYFTQKENGTQVIAFCKFCDQSYIKNATRMERHMKKCSKCPEDVRQQFINVENNKKAKANVFNIKVNEVWPKQEMMIAGDGRNRQEMYMDNGHWDYPGQNSNVISQESRQNVHYMIENQNWVDSGQNLEPEHVDVDKMDEKDWSDSHEEQPEDDEVDQLQDIDIDDGPKQERTSPIALQSQGSRTVPHQRKSLPMRRVTQWPAKSLRASGVYSSLQSKITQEQLTERRALRRVAELELRRKTLEMERFQWEFQRDKAHSELRWAHETRMMQLKEEKERLAIEQSRARGPVS